MHFHKILIAVEKSEHSKTAAKAGLELAQRMQSEVALVSVLEADVNLIPIDGRTTEAELMAVQKEEALTAIHEISSGWNGTPMTSFIPVGDPKTNILTVADAWGAELIVTGTHGRTGLSHLLMGSTADHLIRNSKIPVLVVPLKVVVSN